MMLMMLALLSTAQGYSGIHPEIKVTCDLLEEEIAYIVLNVTYSNLQYETIATKDTVFLNVDEIWYVEILSEEGPFDYDIRKGDISTIDIKFRRDVAKEVLRYTVKFYSKGLVTKTGTFSYVFNLTFGTIEGIPVSDLDVLIRLPYNARYRSYSPDPERIYKEGKRIVFFYDLKPMSDLTRISIHYNREKGGTKILNPPEPKTLELEQNISNQIERINGLRTLASELQEVERNVDLYLECLDKAEEMLALSQSYLKKSDFDSAEAYLLSSTRLIDSIQIKLEEFNQKTEKEALKSSLMYLKMANESLRRIEKKLDHLNGFLWIEPNVTGVNKEYSSSKLHYQSAKKALQNKKYLLANVEAKKSWEYASKAIALADREIRRKESMVRLTLLGIGVILLAGVFAIFKENIAFRFSRFYDYISGMEEPSEALESLREEYIKVSKDYERKLISKEEYERRLEEIDKKISKIQEKIKEG